MFITLLEHRSFDWQVCTETDSKEELQRVFKPAWDKHCEIWLDDDSDDWNYGIFESMTEDPYRVIEVIPGQVCRDGEYFMIMATDTGQVLNEGGHSEEA